MKWFSFLRMLVWLRRIDHKLDALTSHLGRIADALEGKEPPAREVSPETEVTRHTVPSDDDLDRIATIEAHYQRVHGRPPTPEEIVRELDGQEWSRNDLMPGVREKLGL